MNRRALPLLAAVAITAAGCTLLNPPLAAGQGEAEVVALLGRVTARYPLDGGAQRLEFATGPYGRTTWMVDLGADGRSRRWAQVLGTAQFAELQPRLAGMPRDEVLRTLGTPSHRRPGGRAGGELWSWRYPTNDCLWFQVTLGDDGRAKEGSYAIDPMCDVNVPGS